MANAMMFALLAAGAVFLVMFLLRRFGPRAAAGPALAVAGGAPMPWSQPTPLPVQRNRIEPADVIDMPASTAASAASALAAPTAAAAVSRVFVPASFDAEAFARTAKMIFIRLQTAHDTADLDDLRRFTTPELFASVRLDIQERGATPQQTDVLKVESEVLDVVHEDGRQIVSVRFHGQVVEERGAAPTDFNEVWHLVKPDDDSRDWAIAGIEPLN
jgi:predicted lipid-binding transport protein (Tim44 family)